MMWLRRRAASMCPGDRPLVRALGAIIRNRSMRCRPHWRELSVGVPRFVGPLHIHRTRAIPDLEYLLHSSSLSSSDIQRETPSLSPHPSGIWMCLRPWAVCWERLPEGFPGQLVVFD